MRPVAVGATGEFGAGASAAMACAVRGSLFWAAARGAVDADVGGLWIGDALSVGGGAYDDS